MPGGSSSQCKETHHNQKDSETRSRKRELHKLKKMNKIIKGVGTVKIKTRIRSQRPTNLVVLFNVGS